MAEGTASWRIRLRGLRPHGMRMSPSDYLRSGLGALLGLLVAAGAAHLLAVGPADLPLIVAPMGASAVLLFAAPASPLAQPWAVVGGNVVSTVVGVAVARVVDEPALAAAAAVAAAIVVMSATRCLHPPGGACALFAALGTGTVAEQGFAFAVFPVGINSVCLVGIAMLVNNATGRTYPHQPPAPQPAAAERGGLQLDDIRDAIRSIDQGLDVFPKDVLELVRIAEQNAIDRQLGRRTVRAVMEPDVVTVRAEETAYRVRLMFVQDHMKAVPVIDDDRRVVGIVTIYDLFQRDLADLSEVREVMTSPVTTVGADAPVADLVALMTDRGLRHVPVVDADGRIEGVVTRTELIEVLHHALVESRSD